jgi:NAD(P)-dependent dehydrogenase (short-subunit alcohol dehydrogenase family)
MTLDGQVAIVTGASRGLGAAMAKALAAEGATVVVAARTAEPSARWPGTIIETAREIEAEGGTALPVVVDVSDEVSVAALADTVLTRLGRIDVLVNNAVSYGRGRPTLLEIDMTDWDTMYAVNVRGVVLCCKAVLPSMVARGSGSIVNISSSAAAHPTPTRIGYGSSKAALESLTLGLAGEVKANGIAVNALSLGRQTDTPGARDRRPSDYDYSGWAQPEIMGPPAVFLAQQSAETFTGRVVFAEEYGKSWP